MHVAKQHRLFFALCPDTAIQARFERAAKMLQQTCGGKLTPCENMHLTLVFLGNIPAGRVDEVRLVAKRLSAPAFKLDFNQLGCWKRQQIGWSAPSEAPQALFDLVAKLRQGLTAAGFVTEGRPYLPHVTLLRKAKCGDDFPVGGDSIEWSAREFVLVNSTQSTHGSEYKIVGRWNLSGSQGQAYVSDPL